MGWMARLCLVAAVAAAVCVVGSEPAAAKLVKKTVWATGRGDPNPLEKTAPANSEVFAFSDSITWRTRPEDPATWRNPNFEFLLGFGVSPLSGQPGETGRMSVRVEGSVTAADQGAGYKAIPIFFINDRWQQGVVLPQLSLSCFPLGVEPRCSPFSDVATGEATFEFPPITSKADRFSVGIGLLNCGSCYVRFSFTPATVKVVPPMRDKARFLPGRRPTIRIHGHQYDPRNVVVQWGARLRLCTSRLVEAQPLWFPPTSEGMVSIKISPRTCKVFPFKSRTSPGKGLRHSNPRGACTKLTSKIGSHALLRIYVLPKGQKRPTAKHQRHINKCLGDTANKNVKILR